MKLFEIDDGEQHVYAAYDENRAIELYKDDWDWDEYDFTIREIPDNEAVSVTQIDEEDQPVEVHSAYDWATQVEEGCLSTTSN